MRKKTIVLNSLLAGIFIFSLFSYTLAQVEIGCITLTLLGIASSLDNSKEITIVDKFILKGFLILALYVGIIQEIKIIKHTKSWEQYNLYRYTSPAMAMKLFDRLYPKLKEIPNFSYNYATLLCNNNSYEKALNLLNDSRHKIPTSDLYVYIGIANEGLKKDRDAETNYKFASAIVPHLFVPKYFLFKFYLNTDQLNEAKVIAKTIMNQPIKIKNKKVLDIKDEICIFLQHNP